jgi:membrane protein implicated in regulation of membrane protease activity
MLTGTHGIVRHGKGKVVSDTVMWFIVALGLGIAELLSGTFYVLMIALGFAAGGVAAAMGAQHLVQMLAAAAVGMAGVLVLRRTRFGRIEQKGDVAANRNVNLDVGETVQVDVWREDGTARAWYRGAQWDVEHEGGTARAAGAHTIKAVRGNRLIVAAKN